MVKCMICGWEGKQIGTGHLRTHNIKAADYKAMFPNEPLTSKETKQKASISAKNRPPQTKETKNKISKSMKIVYQNTNFPLKEQNKNQFGKDNPFFGKEHSEKTRKILSGKNTEWLLKAYKNGDKISPFKYLGRGGKMSSYELEVYRILKPLNFQYDYSIPFQKGSYLIDFAYLPTKLAIELDSKLHKKTVKRDNRKDSYLESLGWKVIRIPFDNKLNPIDLAEQVLAVVKKELSDEN